VRTEYSEENLSARGAYELARRQATAVVTIFATGSEVEIALAARDLLQRRAIGTRVVSVPCFELFEQQSGRTTAGRDHRQFGAVNIAIEAGVRQGWDRFIGRDGVFIGMNGFGASGPYEKLYEHFGITADAAALSLQGVILGLDPRISCRHG
jgi:transketolase